MTTQRFAFLLLTFLAAAPAHAFDARRDTAAPPVFTGDLRTDLFGLREIRTGPALQDDRPATAGGHQHKSPWIAAGLSLVLPGAGEFYAESYWKSIVFLGIEAAAWIVAYTYDKKGDRQTDFFQGFADQHWSVNRYAQWAVDNAARINPAVRPGDYAVIGAGGRVDWGELNRLERAIGTFFSHTLPPYGEQQYFELIGKYPQFNQGWDDAPANFDYGDPLTPRFRYYSVERGKANDHYATATTFVTIALVNHALSAVDAAWSAAGFNHAHAEASLRTMPGGGLVPTVTLTYAP